MPPAFTSPLGLIYTPSPQQKPNQSSYVITSLSLPNPSHSFPRFLHFGRIPLTRRRRIAAIDPRTGSRRRHPARGGRRALQRLRDGQLRSRVVRGVRPRLLVCAAGIVEQARKMPPATIRGTLGEANMLGMLGGGRYVVHNFHTYMLY